MNLFWEGFTFHAGGAFSNLAFVIGMVCIVVLAVLLPEGWSWLRRKF